MTDTRVPPGDERAQDRETVVLDSPGVARPETAGPNMGSVGLDAELAVAQPDLELSYESGVEVKARSQWAYARVRFFRHKLAVVSLLILLLLGLIALFPGVFAPYGYDEIPFTDPAKIIENPNIVVESINQPPTLKEWHLFGTDQLGRDSLSRVIFGMRTSLWVALFVAIVSTALGTTIGGIAGYYGGVIDNLLMRFTDLVLVLPFLAVLLTAAAFFGTGDPTRVALILALLFWTAIARIIRGVFLSLREKEYVEAAKAAGASDLRIILRHMLPNTVGPIIVNATLVVAAAILTEAALSFLGFGIQPPHPALGALINDGQGEGTRLWWLVTFPGLAIVLIALAVNFVGDGLRDALDPTQRRIRA
jgi:ABC-type dipeptide/oligopeptide/nickel transport system permease subunit